MDASCSSVEHRLNVAGGVQHTNDVDARWHRLVDDHVGLKRMGPQPWTQIVVDASHMWLTGEQCETRVNSMEKGQGNGPVSTFCNNVATDLFQVSM